jgi:hypothetical protein
MYFTGQPGFGGDEPKEQQVEPELPVSEKGEQQ